MTLTPLRRFRRFALLGSAVAALVLGLTTQFSYGGLNASVTNLNDTAGSATLAYTHSYASTSCTSVPSSKSIGATTAFGCTASPVPMAATTATGTVSGTDTITANGSVAANQVSETVTAGSCAPVMLANNATSTNPLLARYGTSFSTTSGPMGNSAGSITVDGANPGGYETSVLTQSLPTTLSVTYGYGIWFKAAPNSAGGPLFGSGDSPGNTTGTSDRVLALTNTGALSFTTRSGSVLVSTGADYRTNSWHFAYVRLTITATLLASTAIYVDGATTAVATTGSGLGLTLTPPYQGYWHVGQSPNAANTSAYFAGAVSNFVVFAASPAAAAPTTNDLASQTSFDSWAKSATDRWRLNDSGTTTFGGPYPQLTTTSPCDTVNAGAGTATSCAYTPASTTAACAATPTGSLSGFANGTPRPIASAAPGGTQALTFTLARGTGYSADFDPGLRLYTPLTFTATSGGWVNTFTWNDSSSVFLA